MKIPVHRFTYVFAYLYSMHICIIHTCTSIRFGTTITKYAFRFLTNRKKTDARPEDMTSREKSVNVPKSKSRGREKVPGRAEKASAPAGIAEKSSRSKSGTQSWTPLTISVHLDFLKCVHIFIFFKT